MAADRRETEEDFAMQAHRLRDVRLRDMTEEKEMERWRGNARAAGCITKLFDGRVGKSFLEVRIGKTNLPTGFFFGPDLPRSAEPQGLSIIILASAVFLPHEF